MGGTVKHQQYYVHCDCMQLVAVNLLDFWTCWKKKNIILPWDCRFNVIKSFPVWKTTYHMSDQYGSQIKLHGCKGYLASKNNRCWKERAQVQTDQHIFYKIIINLDWSSQNLSSTCQSSYWEQLTFPIIHPAQPWSCNLQISRWLGNIFLTWQSFCNAMVGAIMHGMINIQHN